MRDGGREGGRVRGFGKRGKKGKGGVGILVSKEGRKGRERDRKE